MVTRIIILDIAGAALRDRSIALLRAHGYVRLFTTAMWARMSTRAHARLIRLLRHRLRREAHRVLVVRVSERQLREALWLMGPARRRDPNDASGDRPVSYYALGADRAAWRRAAPETRADVDPDRL
jgi:hypothetical protein